MTNHKAGDRADCLHCLTTVKFEAPDKQEYGPGWARINSLRYYAYVTLAQCPACLQFIISIEYDKIDLSTGQRHSIADQIIWPKFSNRNPVSTDVPSHIAQDYTEAALVLELSPKASAALSRRCLQAVLREAAKTKSRDLNDQIDEVIGSLPSNISENLDAIRVIGNFAAHPAKSQSTGLVIDVEVGEAEWNLDVLDSLFDYYYVRPALERKKRDALNQKLSDAGKPQLK